MDNKRVVYLDYLRVISILGVVLLHSSMPLIAGSQGRAREVAIVYVSLSLWCVPVFLMISGALLLQRPELGQALTFYRRRVPKRFATLFCWSVIYYLIVAFTADTGVYIPTFVKRFLTALWDGPLWYLYMLLALYLMLPFLGQAFQGEKLYSRNTAAFLGVIVLTNSVNLVTNFLWNQNINSHYTTALITIYFFYCLLGSLFHNKRLSRLSLLAPVGAFFVASFVTGYLAVLFTERTGASPLFFSYEQPLTMLASCAVFVFFQYIDYSDKPRLTRVFEFLSQRSFGIFLVNNMVVAFLNERFTVFSYSGRAIHELVQNMYVKPLYLTAVIYLTSLALVLVVERIPLVKATIR